MILGFGLVRTQKQGVYGNEQRFHFFFFSASMGLHGGNQSYLASRNRGMEKRGAFSRAELLCRLGGNVLCYFAVTTYHVNIILDNVYQASQPNELLLKTLITDTLVRS